MGSLFSKTPESINYSKRLTSLDSNNLEFHCLKAKFSYKNEFIFQLNISEKKFYFQDIGRVTLMNTWTGAMQYNTDKNEVEGNFEVISGNLSTSDWEIICTASSGRNIYNSEYTGEPEKVTEKILKEYSVKNFKCVGDKVSTEVIWHNNLSILSDSPEVIQMKKCENVGSSDEWKNNLLYEN
jgi:hypothetical protein